MQLPDKNVRPIGFLKLLHSSPLTGQGILLHFRDFRYGIESAGMKGMTFDYPFE
jgi:hypothetical protein